MVTGAAKELHGVDTRWGVGCVLGGKTGNIWEVSARASQPLLGIQNYSCK